MGNKLHILAVGANPAWQKVLQFNNLQVGNVNRADRMWSFASGKGVNFARAARYWGTASVDLVQFAGGDNGKLLLDDLANEQLEAKTIASEYPTRCCITCLNDQDNSMTELIEPSQAPGAEAQAAALEYIGKMMKDVSAAALCGQLPGGMNMDFYLECAKAASQFNKLLLIDSWKNISPLLKCSTNAVLKINTDELAELTGVSDTLVALKMLMESEGLKLAAITAGGGKAYLADKSNIYTFTVPYLERIVNPVGSGDTASAVFLSELVNNTAPEQAFAKALAAASANCLSMKCGEFDRSTAEEFYKAITVETL